MHHYSKNQGINLEGTHRGQTDRTPQKSATGLCEPSLSVHDEAKQTYKIPTSLITNDNSKALRSLEPRLTPADELFAKARELIEKMTMPMTEAEVAAELQVSKSQVKECLQRLVNEGLLEKLSRPVRYRSVSSQPSLFDRRA